MKKLIIHIGTEKTGTTAIQHFCAKNRGRLREQGVVYPVTGFCDFAHFSLVAPFHKLDNAGRDLEFAPPREYLVEEEWARVKEIFSGNSSVTVLISAEHFSSRLKHRGIEALSQAVNWLGDDIAVEIVMFVRRQDKFLQSWYSTHIKAGGTLTFDQAYELKKLDRWFFDYNFIADSWAKVFGSDSIKLNVFEREQMPNGLFAAFADSVGFKIDDDFDFEIPDDNYSWPVRYLEFARQINEFSKVREFKGRYRILDDFSKCFSDRGNVLLSPRRVEFLLDSYRVSNRSLAENYLGRADGRLFSESDMAFEGEWAEPETLDVNEVSRMFFEYYIRNEV